jgi:hypothetical protein
VHDGVHGVSVEDGREGVPITDVQLVDGADEAAGDPFHPGEDLRCAVGVVVDHDHFVAVVQQFHAGVAADETGPAGDEDRRGCPRGSGSSRGRQLVPAGHA